MAVWWKRHANAEAFAVSTAQSLARIGITVNCLPTLTFNANPVNPIIKRVRSVKTPTVWRFGCSLYKGGDMRAAGCYARQSNFPWSRRSRRRTAFSAIASVNVDPHPSRTSA